MATKDSKDTKAAEENDKLADGMPTGGFDGPDGVQEAEAARVDDEQSAKVDVDYPENIPGPRPPRSAPADPDAAMSTLDEE